MIIKYFLSFSLIIKLYLLTRLVVTIYLRFLGFICLKNVEYILGIPYNIITSSAVERCGGNQLSYFVFIIRIRRWI